MAEAFRISPLDREDEWSFELVRVSDGVVVGWFQTAERALLAADNGGELPAPPVEARAPAHDDQLDMFGALA